MTGVVDLEQGNYNPYHYHIYKRTPTNLNLPSRFRDDELVFYFEASVANFDDPESAMTATEFLAASVAYRDIGATCHPL